jgi:starvation-inducible DNA-binding protein
MLAEKMKVLLGTTLTFYWKIHAMHANVEGPEFYQYHTMLQKFYEDVYETVDTIAEYIRTLDTYTPPALQRMLELSVIPEQLKIPRAELMMAEMYDDCDKMIILVNDIFECASNDKVENIANYMAELLDIYTKYKWFFKSTLRKSRA